MSPAADKVQFTTGQRLFAISAIFASVFLLYFKTLDNPLFWDDAYLITNNLFIQHFTNFIHLFDSSYFSQGIEISYRPVTTFTFMIEYSLWDIHAGGYHATNIILHFINSLLFLAILSRVSGKYLLSLAGAVLFAVHPIHTEAINIVTFREDLLAMLFCGSSFLAYVSYRDTGKAHLFILSLLLFVLAVFSKETAVVFPAIILANEYFLVDNGAKGKAWIHSIIFAVPVLFYLFLRFGPMKAPSESIMYHSQSAVTTAVLMIQAMARYINLLVWPLRQCADQYFHELPSIGDLATISSLFLLLGISAFAIILILKKRKVAFGVAWFALFILPVSNIIPIGIVMAERYLYIPAAGFIIAAILALDSIFLDEDRPFEFLTSHMLTVLLVFVIALSSFLTYNRNKIYESPINFWENTCDCAPQSSKAAVNLGLAYMESERLDDAGQTLLRAVRLASDDRFDDKRYGALYRALTNLGIIAARQGYFEPAIGFFEEAIHLQPNASRPYMNLGNVHLQMGHLQSAEKAFRKGLSFEPNHVMARERLGVVLEIQGKIDEAILQFEKLKSLDPDNVILRTKLAMLYDKTGRIKEAIDEINFVIKAIPGDSRAVDLKKYLQRKLPRNSE